MAYLSRTPSPAASASDSDSVVATPMTPRSKLRALYATIDGSDSDSDKEAGGDKNNGVGGENTTPTRKANTKIVKPNNATSPGSGTPTVPSSLAEADAAVLGASSPGVRHALSKVSIDSDDDDTDSPVGPRGRFAARMLDESAEQTEAPLADNARERVKRMLEQAAQAEKQASVETDGDDNGNDAEDEDEDGISAVARPRKLLNRAARRSTSREASPAMFMSPTKPVDREDSPDMFVTPTKGGAAPFDEATSSATNPGRTARFQALVARKREETRKREEEEQRKRAARAVRQAAAEENDNEDDDMLMRDDADDAVSDITDDEGGRRLTQDARPTRKASRKALEEMHRETQRMARNLQLAHEAKTKKKITKASLFERFNFKPGGAATATPATPAAPAAPIAPAAAATPISSSRPTSPTSPQKDQDANDTDTPPSSPPVALDGDSVSKSATAVAESDKGKGKAVATEETTEAKPKRQIRVRLPIHTHTALLDSDSDELEIVQSTKNRLDILFHTAPLKREKEPRSMLALRRLAQIGSPDKKRKQKETNDLTLGELQQVLQGRARHQAKVERDERMEKLRAKGIRIQTEEEREKEMAEVDDIVARARLEAEEIMQREKKAAKQAKKEGKGGTDDDESEADLLDWDGSEDEDGEDFAPEEEKDLELSGSEDEDNEEDADAMDETMEGVLIDDDAAESVDEAAEKTKDDKPEDTRHSPDESRDAPEVLPTPRRTRPANRRNAVLTSDDEDEDVASSPGLPVLTEANTPRPKTAFAKSPSGPNINSDSPHVPTSVLRSATKSFIPGLPVALGGPAGMGLTQIFAGTMADDSQFAGSAGGFGSPSQLMPTIGNVFAGPSLDGAKGSTDDQDFVHSSQPTQDWVRQVQEGGYTGSQAVKLDFSQSQVHGLGSLLHDVDSSQFSDLMESQDLPSQEYTPLKVRFIEHQASTAETVVMSRSERMSLDVSQPQLESIAQSPSPPRRKGKLFRKTIATEADANEEEATSDIEVTAKAKSAFSMLKDASAAKRKQALATAFDRKKSKAKELVEEQAEESEDEYAGLGGADGEDSDNESLASVKDLIDDNQKVTEAESAKLAAFYADRERENDEKQVEKLFRDVTTGMLRRKRGADYDLSDSDDDGEARRRMKRRQFARMQKALFSDERISKVAENPRNLAFLKTIEDRGSDDEMDFIFDNAASTVTSTTTSTTSTTAAAADSDGPKVVIPDSQPSIEPESLSDRRAKRRQQSGSGKNGKKPSNLGEIRESLSNLLEDETSMSVVADKEFGSDEEDDGIHGATKESRREDSEQRRNNANVVDRISLQRANSSTHATAGRTAFDASLGGSPMGPTGFKAPALLRRATTNSLLSATSSRSSSSGGGGGDGNGGGFADQGKIKKNASKQSGINYFARENERRTAMAESDKRRQAKKVRSAEGRSRIVGGLFGAGKFE
ncbi:hypothetical protein CMQ_2848 [Grosmannia clavigera kw1407]|uniref:DNA replication checkpoint mediator MRC1 domain-containing protein n=1 Tax=Grosmannia clavigera (strain kw1407 / UAMH 11150) TaxID=655863 RepID=F0XGS6_GROCL|nr:uncharacterized protein CMQ_2848 [Grosmannia clavigera kw1407]EFX02919.1 hypothetical protein CMQ_2848 [Grosmannia clavigera kw1407]